MSKIHAHFENMLEARNTLKALNSIGFDNAHLDMAGAFDYEFSSETNADIQKQYNKKNGGRIFSTFIE
jgi:hypothetical protein